MDNVCLKIPNIDRVGLVLDISHVLAARHINIISMEVELNIIFLEIESLSATPKKEIIEALKGISQVLDVYEITLMPHQERAEQLKAVLGSINDGIIAIDNQALVTQYNAAAQQIIRVPYSTLIGQPLADIFPLTTPLLETLKTGIEYNNREIVLEHTKSHYLSSGRPLLDQSKRIIGAVAVLRDIQDVRDLVYTVTGQLTFTFDEILFSCNAMQRVVAMAKAIARGTSTVLIRGETGTGKELFARAIHAASPRAGKMFVPINCAAIPDTLLESELFGYEEGAFSGANKGGKQGLFEFASGGTIFLDEIGELSAHLQAKLLRVLQDGKVRRIGSNREIIVDVRILAATNRNLENMIAHSRFREDLYYRLNVIPLFIPPLRERIEDIPLMAQFFVRKFSARLQKKVNAISDTALHCLTHYHWPGNIRELENVIERAINILGDTTVLAEHIILDQTQPVCTPITDTNLPVQQTLAEIVDKVEKDVLGAALRQHRTSRRLGAALGLSHTAVLKKLHKHGLSLPDHKS
ncbi:MAG: tyrR [Firmicutes bacterium]|nr:tyrR [Bacillota bacterium]